MLETGSNLTRSYEQKEGAWMVQRYFVTPEQLNEEQCVMTGADVHHIRRVMRFSVGDQLLCSDGQGRTVLARIEELGEEQVLCRVEEDIDQSTELPVHVTVAQSLPKGDKWEWVLQKGTELGTHTFRPFSSARTIVKFDPKKEAKKRERWQKVIKEAAEQSHRDRLPDLHGVADIQTIAQVEADVKLVAYEEEAKVERSLPSAFVQALHNLQLGQQLLVTIGPEGGFTIEEIDLLKQHGFIPVALGRRILRTETAVPYMLAGISFYFEQLGGSEACLR